MTVTSIVQPVIFSFRVGIHCALKFDMQDNSPNMYFLKKGMIKIQIGEYSTHYDPKCTTEEQALQELREMIDELL